MNRPDLFLRYREEIKKVFWRVNMTQYEIFAELRSSY